MVAGVTASKYPNYSTVIAVHNGADRIGTAISSILKQTPQPERIIVVDDGSTDNLRQSLEPFRGQVDYVFQPQAGQTAAMSRGIRRAQTPLVAFLDADDYWAEDAIASQFACLSPEVDVVSGGLINVSDSPGWHDQESRVARIFGSSLFRREVFSRVGLPEIAQADHWQIEWWSLAMSRGIHVAHNPQLVLNRVIHGGNLTIDFGQDRSHEDLLRQARSHLGRRRAKDA